MSSATVGVGDDDLVTGEAVALDLPPASIGSRMLSGLLDYLLVMVVTVTLASAGTALASQLDDALVTATLLVCFLVAWIGYPVTMETLTRGRSLGKMAAGLRTVRDDAGPITFRHAFTRGLVGVVEVYLLYGIPAIIASVMNKRGKRLGDMLAGTYVVRDRVLAQLPPPVQMPPHLAHWAANADIAALPDDLALAIRTFLPAAPSMTPAARADLGTRLLAETELYVSPPPPPGNHPEFVLAAVLADRRRRDLDRLGRDAALRRRLTVPDGLSSTVPAPPAGMPVPPPPAPPGYAGRP